MPAGFGLYDGMFSYGNESKVLAALELHLNLEAYRFGGTY